MPEEDRGVAMMTWPDALAFSVACICFAVIWVVVMWA